MDRCLHTSDDGNHQFEISMKVLVLGLGKSGKSAASFLEKRGAAVTCVDDTLAPQKIERIEEFDLFVPSPGISPNHPLYVGALKANIPIKGEAQLGLEAAKGFTIGVTGTNGKTSTTYMIEHALKSLGKDFVLISSGELANELGLSQQSASKHLVDLDEEGFIRRELKGRKQKVTLTTDGFRALKDEFALYARIFEESASILLEGNLVSPILARSK